MSIEVKILINEQGRPAGKLATAKLRIEGMHCHKCEQSIHECAGVGGLRIERQYAIDEVERAGSLS